MRHNPAEPPQRRIDVDELAKGLSIALKGPLRNKALQEFWEQADKWRIAMPPVDPLVLDFGLGEFEKTGLIEFWIANEAAAGYCGKYLFVSDGQTCPEHGHNTKHETFFAVKGKVRMTCEGRSFEMTEGDVLPVPPGSRHTFTGIGPALLLEISTPCEIDDNCFSDKRIPIGRNGDG